VQANPYAFESNQAEPVKKMSSSPSHTPDEEISDDASSPPNFRANVVVTHPRNREKPIAKWKKGRSVWMRKSKHGSFDYLMLVVDCDYNVVRGGWDYVVKGSKDGKVYERYVEETDLKKA
jgi:hypothetical protein